MTYETPSRVQKSQSYFYWPVELVWNQFDSQNSSVHDSCNSDPALRLKCLAVSDRGFEESVGLSMVISSYCWSNVL